MINLTTAAFFFLAIGILTSVTLIGLHQILLFVPVMYYLYKTFSEKKKIFSVSSILLTTFIVCCLISLAVNFNEVKDLSKSLGKLKFIFLSLGGISALYYWLPKVKPSHLTFIINGFFSSIIASGGIAIYQVAMTGERSRGFIGVMRYGYVSAMILTLLIAIVIQRKNLKFDFNLKLAITAIFFCFIGLFLTQTRGAMAGFMSALPFVLYFYKPKWGVIFGLISAVLISIVAMAYLFGSSTENKFGSRFLKSKNEIGDLVRREQWQSAVIATKERPLFGWGYGNFYTQVTRIKKENNMKTVFYTDAHAHNTFLEVAAGTGLIGFSLFLLWLITWAYECFKLENALRGIFVPFGVCMIISCQFEVIFDSSNMALFFAAYTLSQVARIMSKTA
jgi:O-antigen ligase